MLEEVVLYLSCSTGNGILVGMLGVAYFANIHSLAYFVIFQLLAGMLSVRLSYIYSNQYTITPVLPYKEHCNNIMHFSGTTI